MRPRQVARGVELFAARTPTLPPATHTNSYALGTADVLLVEPATPYDDEQRAWLDWARELASTGRKPVAIVLTHHHPDHVGGAKVFARELGLPIWAHEATAERLAGIVQVDRRLTDGEAIRLEGPEPVAYEVLHTPGHAPGHVCLFDCASGVVVVGDMVASVGTILIEPRDGDMRVYLQQLERLAGLGANVALPAHGDPIDQPTELFRHYVAHRKMREERVAAALGAEPEGLEALVARAYADTSPMLWPIAKLSLEAHLIKLEHEGRARRGEGGWASAPPSP